MLGRLLARRLEPLACWDVVVPVPRHWWARVKTLHNHAAVIADHAAQCLKIRFSERTLVQVRRVLPQNTLSASRRFENVRGAFMARPERRLVDAHVLLVDDVLTTGATASECAAELLHAGARQVSVAVVARTEPPG